MQIKYLMPVFVKGLEKEIDIDGFINVVSKPERGELYINFSRDLTFQEKHKLDEIVKNYMLKIYQSKRAEILKRIYNECPESEDVSLKRLMNVFDKSVSFLSALDNGNYILASKIVHSKFLNNEITIKEAEFVIKIINKVVLEK